MSVSQSGNKAHDDACNASEATRQSIIVPGVTQAAAKTAEIAHYRACLASAIANKVGVEPFVRALQHLGTGGG